MPFDLVSPYLPAGDQPGAIRELGQGLARGDRYQTLLGVTGSGKTFTMAHVLASFGRPALVLSHNKTLAAQLYGELKGFFPRNAVEFFISYYDYYQPEAYVPQTDTYIAKDSSINDDIDRLRLRATSSLMERDDVIVVASVSAIYGLGDPELYRRRLVTAAVGEERGRDELLEALVAVQYQRNDVAFERGTFRVRGDTVEIFPAYDEQAVRVEFWGDAVERIAKIDPLTGDTIAELRRAAVYPATHFVTERPTIERAVAAIRQELKERLTELRAQNKLLEAQRLESRTHFDIDMLLEVGRCTGIENYSRHLTCRQVGERPACLLDYSPTSTSASSTSRTRPCRSSVGCTKETAPASRPSWTTASGFPRRSTTARSGSTSSWASCRASCSCRRRPGRRSCDSRAASSWSRSSGPRAWWTRKSRCGP